MKAKNSSPCKELNPWHQGSSQPECYAIQHLTYIYIYIYIHIYIYTHINTTVRGASVFPMNITLCYKRFENSTAVKILEYDAVWSGGGYQRFGGNTASISGIPHRTFVLHGHSWQQTMWHVTWSRRLRNVIVWHDIIQTTDRQQSVTLLTLGYGSDTVFTNRTNTRPSLSELRGPAALTLWQPTLIC